jgi:uncharacterized membrane protein YgcG
MRLSTVFCCCVGFLVAAVAAPPTAGAMERILSFDSRIVVQPDATLTVCETIRVQAEGKNIHHGVCRDFPQLYRGRFGLNQRTGFDVVSVRRDGKPEPYRVEKCGNGKRVYFGSSGASLRRGEYTYEFVYRTDRQLGFFDDHDELYWNVTGNGWLFPIDRVTATVALPEGAGVTTSEAYTGPSEVRGRHYQSAQQAPNAITFQTTRLLGEKEGMTIVVAWPKGFVAAPTSGEQWKMLFQDNPGVFLALGGLLLVLVYYALVWYAVGRDPRPGVVVPLYGPPKGFSPAAVRYLLKMGFGAKAFAAALIDLAVKGAIAVEQEDDKYTIHRKDTATTNLSPDEEAALAKLLGSNKSLQLVNTNHATVIAARKALRSSLAKTIEKTYFVRNLAYWLVGLLFSLVPLSLSLIGSREPAGAIFLLVWLTGWTAGVTLLLSLCFTAWRGRQWGEAVRLTLFSIPFVVGECFGIGMFVWVTSFPVPTLFVVGAVLNGVFYHLLKAPTAAGRQILDQIMGFRRYLSVGEEERLNLENPPERTPKLFEMFLPYALALDVEQKWSEQFASVLSAAARDSAAYSPAWYSGTAWSTLGTAGFASTLGSSMSSAIASSSTAPGSSSGGGGGGSSGGGGGGGGGGGW